jgi:hypothetical protein
MSDFWISKTETNPWIKLEFPVATQITKMKTLIWGANASYFQNAKIQGSNNDDTWVDLYTVTSNQGDSATTEPVEVVLGNADFYKYYRIYYTFNSSTGGTARLSEWRTVEYSTPVAVIKSVARKVKKIYVGAQNKARKVKKGYIGVGGVARLFYSPEQVLSRYGTIDGASASGAASTTVGDYALFGGYNTASTAVTTYNSSLVMASATALTKGRAGLAATTVGD